MGVYLQKPASVQPRTSRLKFADTYNDHTQGHEYHSAKARWLWWCRRIIDCRVGGSGNGFLREGRLERGRETGAPNASVADVRR